MKLNKLQRYTAYIIMLQYYKSLKHDTPSQWRDEVLFPYGLCYVFYDVFGIADKTGGIAHVLSEYLPELNSEAMCFPYFGEDNGIKERIAALEFCIKKTHP